MGEGFTNLLFIVKVNDQQNNELYLNLEINSYRLTDTMILYSVTERHTTSRA